MNKKLTPIHPGEVLNEDFLKPKEISQNQIARDIKVPPRRSPTCAHGFMTSLPSF